jgi:hypothetical protein
MVKGKIFDDTNKDFVELLCGYKIIGNPKKTVLLKRLHLSKCEHCKKLMARVNKGSLKVISPDLSDDPKVKYYMCRGSTFKDAVHKVLKEKDREAIKLRKEGDNRLTVMDLTSTKSIITN